MATHDPDRRNFLRDILWIESPCVECSQRSYSVLSIPFLQFRIYDVLAGQGIATCPNCGVEQQLGGAQKEMEDRVLLKRLDDSWCEICDLLDQSFAQLTTPPEK